MRGSLPTSFFRGARRFLASAVPDRDPAIRRVDPQFSRARYCVQFYYLVSAYMSYSLMPEVRRLADGADAWEPLWPVMWLPDLTTSTVGWLSLACLLSSLLAFQFHSYRPARALFAVLFLCVAAVPNSIGGINHGYHAWIWIGFVLVLLPDIRGAEPKRVEKMAYLATISMVQVLLLSFYTLSGFWKFLGGVIPLIGGVEGNFSPRGLALQLADRSLQTGSSPLLADFVISNYWLLWPMFLGLIYLQLVAVFISFRPRLHLVWGYALVGFHTGTWLLMQIPFPNHVLFLLLFFVMSPFRPSHWTVRDVIGDLPVFGAVFRRTMAVRDRHQSAHPVPAE
jgi:hypothetical protein